MKKIAAITVITIFSFIFLSCAHRADQILPHVKPYRIIFTTELTEDNKPKNDLKEISLDENRIYIYIKWQIPTVEHLSMTRIYDGIGNIVFENENLFTPRNSDWNTWTWYNINSYVDKPGRWKFEVYLDGQKMVEEYLTVTPVSSKEH